MDKAEVKKYVGQKIRAYRLHLRLSQFALGEKAGINQRQIAQIESGKSLPSLNTLVKFSEIFHCEIGEFFEQNIVKTKEELKREVINILDEFNFAQLEFICFFIRHFSMIKQDREIYFRKDKIIEGNLIS